MSKIEKALKRAQAERQMALVPTARTRSAPEDSRALVETSGATPLAVAEIEARARASTAIALMREPQVRNRKDLAREGIIHPEMVDNATVQAFREIRTRILQKTQGRNAVIMVTSVVGGSGSSFVSLNLGSAFAFDAGKTALLIDCNLRNPWRQNLLPGQSPLGLTDYLEHGDIDVAQIIHPVGIERLRAIPAGGQREIPGEYFTSLRMRLLLDEIVGRYPERFIIVDAPPMTESADTQILTELCDYVLVVVAHGKVTDSQIAACLKAIDRKKLLGLVFNDEPTPPSVTWNELAKMPLHGLGRLKERLTHLIRSRTKTAHGT
jgi:capsular exopolysaccharide synthesis family protein